MRKIEELYLFIKVCCSVFTMLVILSFYFMVLGIVSDIFLRRFGLDSFRVHATIPTIPLIIPIILNLFVGISVGLSSWLKGESMGFGMWWEMWLEKKYLFFLIVFFAGFAGFLICGLAEYLFLQILQKVKKRGNLKF